MTVFEMRYNDDFNQNKKKQRIKFVCASLKL